MRTAPPITLVRPGSPVVAQRPASLVAYVLAVGVVLGPGQAPAQTGALLQVRVQHIQCVGPQLPYTHLTEDGLDGAPDVALVRLPGRHLKVRHVEVPVQ